MTSSFVAFVVVHFHFAVKMELLTFVLVLCMATMGYTQSFNVTNYGAVGDGKTDDSNAFTKAWEAVCGAALGTNPTMNIPQGKTFLLKPLIFRGPCKSPNVHVRLNGNIVASSNMADWKDKTYWIAFQGIANGLVVEGNGQIDGQGLNWWKACPVLGNGCMRPTAMAFYGSNNVQVNGLKHINSARNHISVSGCVNLTLSNLHITGPGNSPNTDGIDINHSTNIKVLNSNIGTGDDCIAINTESYNINITGVTCGPGHGISVGSLGINGEKAAVEGVHVKDCIFQGTQNAARIKTWQGGSGYARRITFENITLIAAGNPIIIDQFYCPHGTCNSQASAVQISDVSYIGVHGTSISELAINFNCNQKIGCTNILLDHVNITSAAANKLVFSSCHNAHGKLESSIPKVNC